MNQGQIYSDINFLCGSTSGTYANLDKNRNINIEYQRVATLIWQSAGQWQYDDTNSTTLPIAKATLVNNQQDYTLPTTALRLERVQVKDNAGNWSKLSPIDIGAMLVATENEFSTPGLPLYYDLIGNSLMLYPAPFSGNVTLSAGLQIFVNNSVSELGVSATTATPGFAVPFHRMLSYAAAIDFTQDNTMKQNLIILRDRLEKGLTNFYAHRAAEFPTIINNKAKVRWRQYT